MSEQLDPGSAVSFYVANMDLSQVNMSTFVVVISAKFKATRIYVPGICYCIAVNAAMHHS